jgi:hypothetical protein
MTKRSTPRPIEEGSPAEFERRPGPPALLFGVTGLLIAVVPLALSPHPWSRCSFAVVLSATFTVITGVGWAALRIDGLTARDVHLPAARGGGGPGLRVRVSGRHSGPHPQGVVLPLVSERGERLRVLPATATGGE